MKLKLFITSLIVIGSLFISHDSKASSSFFNLPTVKNTLSTFYWVSGSSGLYTVTFTLDELRLTTTPIRASKYSSSGQIPLSVISWTNMYTYAVSATHQYVSGNVLLYENGSTVSVHINGNFPIFSL